MDISKTAVNKMWDDRKAAKEWKKNNADKLKIDPNAGLTKKEKRARKAHNKAKKELAVLIESTSAGALWNKTK